MKRLIALLAGCVLLFAAQYQASAQRVENSSHSTLGYIISDGRVENSSHSTVGYVSNGRVENSSHSTLGYYSGVKAEWVAYYFFFFAK